MAIAVMVTIPKEEADRLAKVILENKVAACVNIVRRVSSYFWWQGKIDEAEESLLIIKSREELFAQLKAVVRNNHPYEVPEIVAVKIDYINEDYLEWLNKETNVQSGSC
jgi:periplasmic divalent cation tolerance protein